MCLFPISRRNVLSYFITQERGVKLKYRSLDYSKQAISRNPTLSGLQINYKQVHGGTTYKDIEKKVTQAEEMARVNEMLNIDTVLFFDEANTTDALGMIKEVMVDRRVNGRKIGAGLRRLQFIAACNPYRK